MEKFISSNDMHKCCCWLFWGFLISVILFKTQNPIDQQRFERMSVLGK